MSEFVTEKEQDKKDKTYFYGFRYEHTKNTGETFNMNFIAMQASVWRYVLDFTDLQINSTVEDHVQHFSDKITCDEDLRTHIGLWGLDQARIFSFWKRFIT